MLLLLLIFTQLFCAGFISPVEFGSEPAWTRAVTLDVFKSAQYLSKHLHFPDTQVTIAPGTDLIQRCQLEFEPLLDEEGVVFSWTKKSGIPKDDIQLLLELRRQGKSIADITKRLYKQFPSEADNIKKMATQMYGSRNGWGYTSPSDLSNVLARFQLLRERVVLDSSCPFVLDGHVSRIVACLGILEHILPAGCIKGLAVIAKDVLHACDQVIFGIESEDRTHQPAILTQMFARACHEGGCLSYLDFLWKELACDEKVVLMCEPNPTRVNSVLTLVKGNIIDHVVGMLEVDEERDGDLFFGPFNDSDRPAAIKQLCEEFVEQFSTNKRIRSADFTANREIILSDLLSHFDGKTMYEVSSWGDEWESLVGGAEKFVTPVQALSVLCNSMAFPASKYQSTALYVPMARQGMQKRSFRNYPLRYVCGNLTLINMFLRFGGIARPPLYFMHEMFSHPERVFAQFVAIGSMGCVDSALTSQCDAHFSISLANVFHSVINPAADKKDSWDLRSSALKYYIEVFCKRSFGIKCVLEPFPKNIRPADVRTFVMKAWGCDNTLDCPYDGGMIREVTIYSCFGACIDMHEEQFGDGGGYSSESDEDSEFEEDTLIPVAQPVITTNALQAALAQAMQGGGSGNVLAPTLPQSIQLPNGHVLSQEEEPKCEGEEQPGEDAINSDNPYGMGGAVYDGEDCADDLYEVGEDIYYDDDAVLEQVLKLSLKEQ